MDELARMLSQVEMRVLLRIWKLQQRNPDGIKIDSRELAKDCKIARSGIKTKTPAYVQLSTGLADDDYRYAEALYPMVAEAMDARHLSAASQRQPLHAAALRTPAKV